MVLEGERPGIASRRACEGSPGWEACPVLKIDFLGRTPRGVCSFEEVLRPDYFAFEERCQGRMVIGEACNVTLRSAAEVGVCSIEIVPCILR